MEPEFTFINSRKKAAGKAKLISKVVEQKSTFEATQKQILASINIQKNFRRFITRRGAIREFNDKLTKRLSDLGRLQGMLGEAFFVPLKLLCPLIRDFAFVYSNSRSKVDLLMTSKFEELSKFVEISCKSEKENILEAIERSRLYKGINIRNSLINSPLDLDEACYLSYKKMTQFACEFLNKTGFQFKSHLSLLLNLLQPNRLKSERATSMSLELFNKYDVLSVLSDKLKRYNDLVYSDQAAESVITTLLDLSLLPIHLPCSTNSIASTLVDYQSKFLLTILSCPGHIVKILLKNPYLEKSQIPRFYSSFMFSEFSQKNQNTLASLKSRFTTKFKNREGIIHLLGNTLFIIDEMYYKGKTTQSLQHLLIVSTLILHIVSPSFLDHIFNFDITYEKEFYLLKTRIMSLFEGRLVKWLFGPVLEYFKHTEYANCVPQLYAGILLKARKSENSFTLVAQLTSAMILTESTISQLLGIFDDHLLNPEFDFALDYLLNEVSIKEALLLFLFAYYNTIQIYDIDDFKASIIFSSKSQISRLVRYLVNFVVKAHLDPTSDPHDLLLNSTISYYGSKIVVYLFDFNSMESFSSPSDWILESSIAESILQDIVKKRQANGVLPESFGIVKLIPFCLPFDSRMELLIFLLDTERKGSEWLHGVHLQIRRSALFEDGFTAFTSLNSNELKSRIQITFIDETGYKEIGMDAGGLFKEFLNEICGVIFDSNYGLFLVTDKDQQLYPNPYSTDLLGTECLETFLFVGTLVGRAILEKILIGKQFSPFFLRKILGKINLLNELSFLDPELHKNLKFVKNYTGNVEELGLTFSMNEPLNPNKVIELRPGGAAISVTDGNRFSYIYSVANYKLNEQIRTQLKAFVTGLNRVFPAEFLQIFHESELQKVISGDAQGFNVSEFREAVTYSGYTKEEKYIQDFWKFVFEMEDEDLARLVKFVTSCERPPLMGFKNLNPPFCIVKANSEKDTNLPTASTCFNRLNLPFYSKVKVMKEKLMIAIRHGTGFYLA